MDSHGGWIASAIDLARFATAFDSPDQCPVLDRTSIDQMHARPTPPQTAVIPQAVTPEANATKDTATKEDVTKANTAKDDTAKEDNAVYYSLGWNNRELPSGGVHHWHSGSLPGTSTILIRRHDKKNFIALLNTRHSPKTEKLGAEVDRALHEAAAEVPTWPTHNHFEKFSIAHPD